MRSFECGQVYFMATYPDVLMAYPEIQSFVYLGKDLSYEDDEDTWYFQPVEDYVKNGSALMPSSDIREALCMKEETVEAMLDDEKLFDEIRGASLRRSSKKRKQGSE